MGLVSVMKLSCACLYRSLGNCSGIRLLCCFDTKMHAGKDGEENAFTFCLRIALLFCGLLC